MVSAREYGVAWFSILPNRQEFIPPNNPLLSPGQFDYIPVFGTNRNGSDHSHSKISRYTFPFALTWIN